ncbi:MAG: UvrD-helicase domain-containing protein [Dehalococcoidia bacterium]
MDILAELNPAQRQAVESIEGPLLIVAGPGSGKTRVITHRIAYLVRVCGIRPHRIMAVTFTNKAAREMKERLDVLLGESAGDLTLGTFHAICARILRQDGKAIGLDPRFTIYDDDDQLNLIKQSLQETGIDPKQYTPRAVQSAISYSKSHLLTPGDYAQQSGSYFEEVVSRVYEHYQRLLVQSQTVDFDDLLMKVVQLFEGHENILKKYQTRYLHILVDEFQDTNVTQYKLIHLLGGKHKNICVVGDPDQSIYSWRHADIRNILSFRKDYPESKVAFLEENYRSTRTILEAASGIISANVQREPISLRTSNEEGNPVSIVETYTEGDEAQFVVSEIDRLAGEEGISASECAVMYRVNAQSRVLEEAFIRHGMPYRLVGGVRFYQRREIKDIIAYLRFIHNTSDSLSLTRIINVPGRGIGTRTMTELKSWAHAHDTTLYHVLEMVTDEKGPHLATRALYALNGFISLVGELTAKSKEMPLSDFILEVVEKAGYHDYIMNDADGRDRWENIMELRTVAREYDDLSPEEALNAFLEKVSLISDLDEVDEKAEVTTLTTLHQAKGLEFSVVFIVGMEEGLLPHRRSIDEGNLEEERRLCYVGVTRAKKRVYLVHTYRRSLFGSSTGSDPSRFLSDIPSHLTSTKGLWDKEYGSLRPDTERDNSYDDDDFTPVTELYKKKAQVPVIPLPSVSPGDYVRHAMFGEGVVLSCIPVGDDQQVTVNFETSGTRKLLLSFAPLEKLQKEPYVS